MKQILLIITLLLYFPILVFSQMKVASGFSSTHDFYQQSPFFNRNLYGIQLQYFLGKRKITSLNNRLLFGVNEKNNRIMLHYGLGGLLSQASLQNGVIFIGGNIIEDLAFLVLLPIIIPEGIQFHLGSENIKISPYIYPASFEYNVLFDDELKALFETGIQFKFINSKKFFIAPSFAWKMRYGDNLQAFSIGLMVGGITD